MKLKNPTSDLELIRQEGEAKKKAVAVLFVHGLYHGAWAFKDTLLPFFAKRGFDTYAMSFRGHGLSAGREQIKKARLDDYYQDLCQVVQGLGRPVILVGHSAGGVIVQKYLQEHTAAGAVLVGTPSGSDMKAAMFSVVKKFPGLILKYLITGNPDHIYHNRDFLREILFAGDMSSETETVVQRLMQQTESHKIAKDLLAFKARPPCQSLPVFILGGESDASIKLESYDECARTYSGKVKIYPAKSHELLFTPGWESIAAEMVSWMETEAKIAA